VSQRVQLQLVLQRQALDGLLALQILGQLQVTLLALEGLLLLGQLLF
jgi:hypothetical protein